MSQNCHHCREQGKNVKSAKGKSQSLQMEPVVETNEEKQLNFVGPLPDNFDKDAYILVAQDKWSKFPRAKKFHIFCRSYKIKLVFTALDDHRLLGVVERPIRTLIRMLGVMRLDGNNYAFELASNVADIIKTLSTTPHGITKVSYFSPI